MKVNPKDRIAKDIAKEVMKSKIYEVHSTLARKPINTLSKNEKIHLDLSYRGMLSMIEDYVNNCEECVSLCDFGNLTQEFDIKREICYKVLEIIENTIEGK